MSKFTKPADIARQSGQSQYDRPKDYCPGCGYRFHVNGVHGADCTNKEPADA